VPVANHSPRFSIRWEAVSACRTTLIAGGTWIMLRTVFIAVIALGLSAGAGPVAWAAGDDPVSTNPDYERAIQVIKNDKDYRRAIELLNKALASNPKDVDAENMLGYCFRKLGDFPAAQTHYEKALALDPDHKGAHEYMGEMYLQLDNLAKAQEHLARLDKICWLGCEEYKELRKAIREYEAKHKSASRS
jgi:tetratricopeptide (TPR) repeat protein